MKPLDIRFAETTNLKLTDLANVSDVSKSDLARIAMAWGIDRLESLLANKNEVTTDFLKVEALKAKQ